MLKNPTFQYCVKDMSRHMMTIQVLTNDDIDEIIGYGMILVKACIKNNETNGELKALKEAHKEAREKLIELFKIDIDDLKRDK